MTTRLRGSSWAHTRGHDSMVAASTAYRELRGVDVEWTPRTLTDFGVQSVSELAREFDLVVVDHPHVGTVAADRALIALDEHLDRDVLATLSHESPGRSHDSYRFDGHQWALAIDAACQVAAATAELDDWPRTWDDVVDLARERRVVWPVNPVDAQASFLTIAAALGTPIDGSGDGDPVSMEVGLRVFALMDAVIRHLDSSCLRADAIAALDALGNGAVPAMYCPLVFGYTNYARHGYRPVRLRFGDIPRVAPDGAMARGSLLGGVGLGVSAFSAHVAQAVEFTAWLASGPGQGGAFLIQGGQPAHASVWDDPAADELTGGFFSGVRATLEASWMRPRVPGYVTWQNASLAVIHDALSAGRGYETAVVELNRIARRTWASAARPHAPMQKGLSA